MISENFSEMKRCKTDWLDDIYWGTTVSKGTRNAVSAIKLVLFDDYSVVPEGMDVGDKYEFISSKNDGRAKAKMLQAIDLIQILAHYALASFGLRNEPFTIDQNTYTIYRTQKVVDMGYTNEFIIELVAYSLFDSIYGGYLFIANNKFIKEQLLNNLINERYIEDKASLLDNFDGYLTNPLVAVNVKKQYLEAFNNLDEDFFKIKRRDAEYISYSKDYLV